MKNITSNTSVKSLNASATKLEVVAMIMNVQKSAISKLQNKRIGDIPLSKLQDFINAVGGEFSAEIKLANGDVLTL